MTDRELLEAAARAAGFSVYFDGIGQCCKSVPRDPMSTYLWAPLTDDGDAFRLAVALRIDVVQFTSTVRANAPEGDDCHEAHGSDPAAATRRAIVRAAAALDRA